MKEFYLIPKTVYDRYMSHNSNLTGGGEAGGGGGEGGGGEGGEGGGGGRQTDQTDIGMETTIPLTCLSLPQRPKKNTRNIRKINKPRDPIILKTMSRAKHHVDINPSLSNLIDLKFPLNTRYKAHAFLKIIENIHSVKWNEEGDLLYPLNKYNILDFIENIISPNTIINSEYLDDYTYLINTMNIPIHLIRNITLKRYISTGSSRKRQYQTSIKPQSSKQMKKKGGNTSSLWIPY